VIKALDEVLLKGNLTGNAHENEFAIAWQDVGGLDFIEEVYHT